MDYVPKKGSAFLVWVRSLFAYVQAHLTAFNILETVFQPLLALNTVWKAAYAKTLDPNRGAVDVADKNEALERAWRNFIKAFPLYSPFVSDNDRDETQIPIHNTKSTPVQPLRALYKTNFLQFQCLQDALPCYTRDKSFVTPPSPP